MLIGAVYFTVITFSAETIQHPADTKPQPHTGFTTTLYSVSGKDALVNIVSNAEIEYIKLNGQDVELAYVYPATRVSHQDAIFGDIYRLPLDRQENTLDIKLLASPDLAVLRIGQKYTFIDFVIFSVFLLLPASWLAFHIGSRVLDHLLITGIPAVPVPIWIFGAGIVIRLWYAYDMGFIQFQHDYHGHVEYIKFIAKEFFVPLPHKAWEFPQQPVYYLFNGAVYAVLEQSGIGATNTLMAISWLTTLLSCVGLIYAYRLVRLLSENTFVQSCTMIFIGFMPSLVYMSSRINNDPWLAALSIITLYYLIASYQVQWQRYFYRALIFSTLMFLTKISSLVVVALMFSLLIASYLKQPEKTLNAFKLAVLIGAVVLLYTLYRAYYPAAAGLALVNSGIWPGQDLRPITLSYFFSFNLPSLVSQAQSHIGASDNLAITRSFFTYQYATMIFGEFDYSYWRNQSNWLFFNMQFLIVLALVVPLGWIGYCCLKQKTLLDWLFIAAVGLSFLLLLRFIFSFPSVSNTDFRYHAAIIFILAYFFAQGLNSIRVRYPIAQKLLNVWLTAFVFASAAFLTTLIRL